MPLLLFLINIKNEKKFDLLFLLILLLPFPVFSQTYIAKYKCYYGKGITLSDIAKTNIGIDTTEIFSINLILNYTIKTNGRYMEAEGVVDSSSASFVPMSFTATKAIFDLKNHLVYFPDENKIQRLKIYEVTATSSLDSCAEHVIIGFDSRYKILACTSLPSYLSPPVHFKGLQKGVKSIITPNFAIVLLEHKTSNEELDYKKIFETWLAKKVIEEYKFIE